MIPATRRERFLGQNISTRLGGLAADLARVVSASQIPAATAVSDLLDESRAFIEWTAPSLLPERIDDAARLVDIGRGVTAWYHTWHKIINDPRQRHALAAQARAWSDEVLAMSGLLNEE